MAYSACGQSPVPDGTGRLTTRRVMAADRTTEVYRATGEFPVIYSDYHLYDTQGSRLTKGRGVFVYPGSVTEESIYFVRDTAVYRIDGGGRIEYVKKPAIKLPMNTYKEYEPDYQYFDEPGVYGIGMIWRGDTLLPVGFHGVEVQPGDDDNPKHIYGWRSTPRRDDLDTTFVYNQSGRLLRKFAGYVKERLPSDDWVYERYVPGKDKRGLTLHTGVIRPNGEVLVEARPGVTKIVPFGDYGYAFIRRGKDRADDLIDAAGELKTSRYFATLRDGFYVEYAGERLRATTYSGNQSVLFDAPGSLDRRRYQAEDEMAYEEKYAIFERGDSTLLVNNRLVVVRAYPDVDLTFGCVDSDWVLLPDKVTLLNPNSGEEIILPLLAERQSVSKIVYANGRPARIILGVRFDKATGIGGPSKYLIIDAETRARSDFYNKLKHLDGDFYLVREEKTRERMVVEIK